MSELPTESIRNERLESGQVECVLGIDEAGRGPVLGAMSFGVAYWPKEQDTALGKLGFADSKVLKEVQRDALFEKMYDSLKKEKKNHLFNFSHNFNFIFIF